MPHGCSNRYQQKNDYRKKKYKISRTEHDTIIPHQTLIYPTTLPQVT